MVDSGSGIIDSNESGELYLPAKKTTNIIKSMHKIYASI
jgi:hypothetical protein